VGGVYHRDAVESVAVPAPFGLRYRTPAPAGQGLQVSNSTENNSVPHRMCCSSQSPPLPQPPKQMQQLTDLAAALPGVAGASFGFTEQGTPSLREVLGSLRAAGASVIQVFPEGTYYGGVTEAAVDRIVSEHLLGGSIVDDFAYQPTGRKQTLRPPFPAESS
jgi:(2Fe-2S) ferredoxin